MTLHDPIVRFEEWLREATESEPNDPTAMTLATATASGAPSARMVLLKAFDAEGFVFYTNTGSRKGQELAENQQVALLFHWKSLRRQIRIEGVAGSVTTAEADAYFASRPRVSRLGAWASDQSRPLAERAVLEQRLAEAEARFPDETIPRPLYWTGYRIAPHTIEFWQDGKFRLHDREVFRKTEAGWECSRLYP